MPKPYWQILPKSLALCTLLGLLTAALFTFFQPKVYESTSTIQIRPQLQSFEILADSRERTGLVPIICPSGQFDILKAQKTLDIVIDHLDLEDRWHLDRDTVRQQLSENIHVQNIKGTDLIEIRVQADSPEEAQAITEKLSEAYRARRTKLESQRCEQALEELRDAVQKQEDSVEDKRKTLTTIIRNQELLLHHIQPNKTSNAYSELLEQKVLVESQIETLLKYDGDQLMTYAAGLQLPENIIRVLHPQYLEAKRSLDALRLSGLGNDHPNVKQQQEVVEGMRLDLDEGVVALRETLRAQLELTTEQISRLKENIEKDRGLMLLGPSRKEQRTMSAFNDAKAEFETAQRLLEQLKIKLIGEEMQRRITDSPIIIHAEPFAAEFPIYPTLPRNLIIGSASGLLIGLILPFLIIPALGHRTPPPKQSNSQAR